ncbi:MAG: hypothetical protein IJ404_05735 [Clostridia bacterium]|nr:hypothetical protein [Clostridia bacterium]
MSVSKIDVINLLLEHPDGLKAKEIASYLSTGRKEANQMLYSNPNDFTVNDSYVWKIRNQTQNKYDIQKKIREETLKELKDVYKLGYLEIQELEKLTFENFQRASEHAKLISKNTNLPYMTSKEWSAIIVLESNEFKKAIMALEAGEKAKREELKRKREIRNKELAKIAGFCNKHNLSQNTKARLVLTGKSYSEIYIVWDLCQQNSVSEYTFLSLLENDISYSEIQKRISKIKYYQNKYPDMNIVLSEHILSSEHEFNRYTSENLQKPLVRCLGDCSNCKRDICIMDK